MVVGRQMGMDMSHVEIVVGVRRPETIKRLRDDMIEYMLKQCK